MRVRVVLSEFLDVVASGLEHEQSNKFFPTATPPTFSELVDTHPVHLPRLSSPAPIGIGAPSLGYPSGSYASLPPYKMPPPTYYPRRGHFSPEPNYQQEDSAMSDISSVSYSHEKRFKVLL